MKCSYRVRLSELLEENGISVYRLLKTLPGVAPSTLYGIRNRRRQPDLDTLAKIHCALEALLGREVGLEEILEVVREGGRSS